MPETDPVFGSVAAECASVSGPRPAVRAIGDRAAPDLLPRLLQGGLERRRDGLTVTAFDDSIKSAARHACGRLTRFIIFGFVHDEQ
jgi:hypothetical protein